MAWNEDLGRKLLVFLLSMFAVGIVVTTLTGFRLPLISLDLVVGERVVEQTVEVTQEVEVTRVVTATPDSSCRLYHADKQDPSVEVEGSWPIGRKAVKNQSGECWIENYPQWWDQGWGIVRVSPLEVGVAHFDE